MTDSARARVLLEKALDALVAQVPARANDLVNQAHRLDKTAPLIPDLGALLTFANGEYGRTDLYTDRAIRRHWAMPSPPIFSDDINSDREIAAKLIRFYRAIRAAAEGSRRGPRLLTRLGQLNERIGNEKRALEIYEEMRANFPGSGSGDTGRALAYLKSHGRLAPSPELAGNGPAVSKADIGSLGRFANQILQYIYLRTYARRVGATPLAPNWIGRHLFDLDDAPIDRILKPMGETDRQLTGAFAGTGRPIADIDIRGFMQIPTADYAQERDWLQSLFVLRPYWRRIVDDAEAAIRADGRTLIAVHVRLGDMSARLADPLPAIARLLEDLWPKLDRPVLYAASDDPARVMAALTAYRPKTDRDLWEPFPGVEYLVDHQMLARADVLIVAPGTFSFTAAMLNQRANSFYRADPETGTVGSFDPWDDLPGAPANRRIAPDQDYRRKDGSIVVKDMEP